MRENQQQVSDNYYPTKLEINLASIAHNFRYFRKFIPAATEIMAMIKASAYGNGAVGLGRYIEKESLASYLAVAYVQEGVELRNAGIKLPILVLNPHPSNFKTMIQHALEPEIHHIEHLKSFEKALDEHTLTHENYPLHLKVNSGMNRLGFDKEDLPELLDCLRDAKAWKLGSLMTHLSASDDIQEKEYTQKQFYIFDEFTKHLMEEIAERPWRHVLNSNGIFHYPDYHYEMVRLGIGMYGASALPTLKKNLKEIAVFKTQISQSRKLSAGETVGYSRAGEVKQTANIATLAVGYADGFSRSLGNGNWLVEIKGKMYPTIGNVCMDMCMINLEDDVYEDGEEVILFGGKKSIHDYAEALGTITYEAMCRVGERVERLLI